MGMVEHVTLLILSQCSAQCVGIPDLLPAPAKLGKGTTMPLLQIGYYYSHTCNKKEIPPYCVTHALGLRSAVLVVLMLSWPE